MVSSIAIYYTSSIEPKKRTLTGTATPGQSGLTANCDDRVRHIAQKTSRLGLYITPIASLQRGKTPPKECPGYDIKQSDYKTPVYAGALGNTKNHLWSSLLGSVWPGVAALDRVLSK